MVKTLPEIITATIILALIASATAVYLTISLNNTGTIVAHGCKVYLENKTTESYTINWGEIKINQTITNYRWIYNNGTVTTNTNLTWYHNAPNHLTARIHCEQADHTWQELLQNQTKTFNSGEWIHTKIELTTLPDAINHQGPFTFNIFVGLT